MRETVRALLVAALGGLLLLPGSARGSPGDDFPEAARAVNAALGEKDPGPLADALWNLRRHDGAPAAKLLLSAALRREVPDFVMDAAVDALGEFRSPEAAAVIAAEAGKAREERLFPLLEALGRLKDGYAEEALLPFLDDADPRVRTAALRALSDRKEVAAATRAAAEKSAADSDPRVRSAAIAALVRWKGTASGLPLLGRMAVEKGRLFGDAWRGLVAITGENRPPDPEEWADWWRTMPGEEGWHFDEPPGEPLPPSVRIAGLSCWSRRVVFVLDTSEGMADRPGYRLDDIVPEEVKRAGGKELAAWSGVKTRLDHAVQVLARTIEALPADAAFDVHFGDEAPSALFRKLEPATAENKGRAVARRPGGNRQGPPPIAPRQRPPRAGGPDKDPFSKAAFLDGADTVVYVGSALPSWGAEKDGGRIVSTLRRWNRVRQVRFLGVGVGNHGADLLAGLASISPSGGSTAIP